MDRGCARVGALRPDIARPVIAVVAGHPSIDRLYEVEVLRPGEIHRLRPSEIHALPGGKGLNVARAIANLGASAHVFGILAGYAGRWIASAVSSEGLEATFVWAQGETRTSVSVAATAPPGAPSTDFYEESPAIQPDDWTRLESALSDAVKDAELVCLSGSLIPGAPEGAYHRIAQMAHAAGKPVAVDSSGPQFLKVLDAQPELVKINLREAADALGIAAPQDRVLEWASSAAANLRERAGGNAACAITCGPAGMALVDREGAVFRGRLDRVGNYPVGSGDAALGAFAVAFVSGLSSRETLALALGAGAANAEVPGPGLLTSSRARSLAERASIELVDN